MLPRITLAVVICLTSTITMADSISVILKPEKGLPGTVSFNVHDDGNATILVYESSVKINESTVNIEANIKEKLRLLTLKALDSYLSQNSYVCMNSFYSASKRNQ